MSAATASRLSDALKNELAERGWPQKKLAERLKRDESTVSLWISGRKSPRIDDTRTVTQLARFLDTSSDQVRDLIAAEKTPNPNQPARTQSVSSLSDLDQLLDHNPFLDRLTDLRVSRPLASGFRERLAEEGYLIDREVAEAYVERRVASQLLKPPRKIAVPALGGEAQAGPAVPDSPLGREAVRQACRRTNALFIRDGDVLPEETVLECARKAFSNCLETRSKDVLDRASRALLTQWVRMRLVKDPGDGSLVRAWPLNPEFVLNATWGLRTGVPNFDFLWDGGLLPPVEAGMAVLIKGKAGRGKTMLAVQLAATIAGQGHCAVYLTAEESADQIAARLSWAGFELLPRTDGEETPWASVRAEGQRKFELLTTNDLLDDDAELFSQRMDRTGGGVLAVVESFQRKRLFDPSSRLLSQLERIWSKTAARGRLLLTVIDSLDALDLAPKRDTTRRIFSLARRRNSLGIFVSEIHDSGAAAYPLRDYLADTVIRVGDRTRVDDFSERIVEIEKCRVQSFIRGEHMMAIHGGRGVSVYPSIQSLLSVWRRRVRRVASARPVSWKLEGLDFDDILNGDAVTGSTILLSGPPKTHRILLGLGFLAAGLESDPDSRVMLVSLREDPSNLHRIIAAHPQLSALLDPVRPDALNPRLRVIHVPPDYFAPERFIHWIQKEFRRYEERGETAGRVLFSSIQQLLHNSPMFDVEKLFIDALLEFFKRKQVTSMFLGSESKREEEVASAFDVLLFTGRTKRGGRERVTFRVSHSGPCNAKPGLFAVDRTMDESRARLSIEELPDAAATADMGEP